MNRRHRHRHGHDHDLEREWALQERAFSAERVSEEHTGHDAGSNEPGLAEYRRIARALRRPPAERLPSNFAWQMAQLAARLPRASRLDLRLESWLVRSLAAAMVLGGLVVAALYGMDWLRALDATGNAGNWVLLVAACVGLSWLPEGWRRLSGPSRVDGSPGT